MKVMAVILTTGALAASLASAGVLDECKLRGDRATVEQCLLAADRDAREQLNKVEGETARLARELDAATGRALAAPALARAMRAFGDYRKAHCEFERTMYADPTRADQAQLACMVDVTRRRVRDLQN